MAEFDLLGYDVRQASTVADPIGDPSGLVGRTIVVRNMVALPGDAGVLTYTIGSMEIRANYRVTNVRGFCECTLVIESLVE